MSHVANHTTDSSRYAKCVEVSKRVRWDIDRDVIRGRQLDFGKHFLPDGLSKAAGLAFLSADEMRLLSQVQGRTYANMFALVERFIGAKVLEVSREHWLGDQVALEALVRFTDEELKHQELFRRIEELSAEGMPEGYEFVPKPNAVALDVLSKSTWAVLGLTLHIELFSQEHYRQSIEPDEALSGLYRDVFFYHWREESQHAILDELEWLREDARLSAEERDRAVTDLIDLVGAVDAILQAQAVADARFLVTLRAGPALRRGAPLRRRFLSATTGRARCGITSVRVSISTSNTGGITSAMTLRSSKKAWRTLDAWIATSSISRLPGSFRSAMRSRISRITRLSGSSWPLGLSRCFPSAFTLAIVSG